MDGMLAWSVYHPGIDAWHYLFPSWNQKDNKEETDDILSLAVLLRAHGFMTEPGMSSFLDLSIFVT